MAFVILFFSSVMSRCVSTIICGCNKTLSISIEGNVCPFGYSLYGALGSIDEGYTPGPVSSLENIQSIGGGDYHSLCLDYSGNVYSIGCNVFRQLGVDLNRVNDEERILFTHIPQKVNVPSCTQISCGAHFTICLTNDGRVYSFGCNANGNLGKGNQKK